MKVAIIGTDFMCLALGIALANAGHTIYCVDDITNIKDVDMTTISYYDVETSDVVFTSDENIIKSCDIVLNNDETRKFAPLLNARVLDLYKCDTSDVDTDVDALLVATTELLNDAIKK